MRALPKIVAAASAALLTLSVASPAFAHVDAEGEVSGDELVVTFSFEHGCAGSPTTSLKVQLPAETTVAGTDQPTGWTVTTTGEQIDWAGGSIPDGETGTFTATLSLDAPAGTTIFFPTVQGCASGENAWIDKSEDPEAEKAAPRVTLTEAVSSSPSTTEATTGTTRPATPGTTAAPATTRAPAATTPGTTTAATSSTSSDSSPLGLILGIIAAVIVVGGAAVIALRLRDAKAADAAAGATGGDGDGPAGGS